MLSRTFAQVAHVLLLDLLLDALIIVLDGVELCFQIHKVNDTYVEVVSGEW